MKPSFDNETARFDPTLPHHPGRILHSEFRSWLNITRVQAGERMGVTRELLDSIVGGKRNVTENVALRFQGAFRTVLSPWLTRTLQVYGYDPFDEVAVYLLDVQSRRNLEIIRRRDLADFVPSPIPSRNIVPHYAIRADSPSSST